MIQKIKKFILVTITGLTMLAPALVPAMPVFAAEPDTINAGLCTGVTNATGGTGGCTSTDGTASIKTLASKIINIFSILVGIIAVVMVIFGGFKYITSGGDSGNVTGAKNTLIYAIIGLLVVALSQFIVHFVLSTATTVTGA